MRTAPLAKTSAKQPAIPILRARDGAAGSAERVAGWWDELDSSPPRPVGADLGRLTVEVARGEA